VQNPSVAYRAPSSVDSSAWYPTFTIVLRSSSARSMMRSPLAISAVAQMSALVRLRPMTVACLMPRAGSPVVGSMMCLPVSSAPAFDRRLGCTEGTEGTQGSTGGSRGGGFRFERGHFVVLHGVFGHLTSIRP